MGKRGRCLRVGQDALTDYNGPGPMTRVTIVEADYTRKHGHSQSGTMFRVFPTLKNGTEQSWYDADWFEPAPPLPETGDMFKESLTGEHLGAVHRMSNVEFSGGAPLHGEASAGTQG